MTRMASLIALAACSTDPAPLSVVRQASTTCAAANVWATPPTLQYQTVLLGTEEHLADPTFSVHIELPDGSAGDIDVATVQLNGFAALPEPTAVEDNDEHRDVLNELAKR